MTINWSNPSKLSSRQYICGWCDNKVAVNVGYYGVIGNKTQHYILICSHCNLPTLFDDDKGIQAPQAPLGRSFDNLPPDIAAIYKEIRDATSLNAYTLAVMGARKLLMHIAVEKKADPNLKFVEYVDYLVNNHFTPPNSKILIDKIRTFGNDANHEIILMNKENAQHILDLVEMLLTFLYEYHAKYGTTS